MTEQGMDSTSSKDYVLQFFSMFFSRQGPRVPWLLKFSVVIKLLKFQAMHFLALEYTFFKAISTF